MKVEVSINIINHGHHRVKLEVEKAQLNEIIVSNDACNYNIVSEE